METIERQVSSTILQQPFTLSVGLKTYQAAPPSVATLILVSEAVSRIPATAMDDKKIIETSLAVAADCAPIAEIGAILILGAKAIRKSERGLKHRIFRRRTALERLTEELLLNYSPADLFKLISTLLATMQVGDFFALTTFLQGVNLLRPTKVVDR